ncbi:hypothetical protein D3C76_118940 [compost metagenome]
MTMNNDHYLQLWDQVLLRVLDVRLRRIEAGELFLPYTLPASTFIFCSHGRCELWLDEDIWLADSFYLLHSGKGKKLKVNTEQEMELYFIFYKAVLPPRSLREFHMLMQANSPFEQTWGMSPAEPLELHSLVRQLLSGWYASKSPVSKLQVKGVFMQFLHHVLKYRHRRFRLSYCRSIPEIIWYSPPNRPWSSCRPILSGAALRRLRADACICGMRIVPGTVILLQ